VEGERIVGGGHCDEHVYETSLDEARDYWNS
jgi:hypothetical protein